MNPTANDLINAARLNAEKLQQFSGLREKWQSAPGLFFAGLTLPVPGSQLRLSASDIAGMLYALGEISTDTGFNFSMAAHLFAGVIPLGGHGKNTVHQQALQEVSNGAILANAMTESSSGSDAFKMKTTAVRNGSSFVLNGSKTFVTNGPVADYLIVYAITDAAKGFFGGVTCFLLDKREHHFKPGSTINKTGLRNSPMCEIYFDECAVDETYVIGTVGGGSMIFLESMDWERACIAALHAGTISRVCKEVSAYVKSRVRGDRALADLQAVQFRIADIAMFAETSNVMAQRAAHAVDQRNGLLAAAQAKIVASESLMQAAITASTLMGGNGVTAEAGLSDLLADAQAALIYSGPNDVLRELIASRL